MSQSQFEKLLDIVACLRAPDGCPWDRAQTHESLAPYCIEEAHELAEAIESLTDKEICEELGDLLLQVVLHSQLAHEREAFDIDDVIEGISQKMLRRHPHVFGKASASSPEEVAASWATIKAQEKKGKELEGVFSGIPADLPALMRSQKIGQKTIRYNFDWENTHQVIEKVEEELNELKQAIDDGHPNSIKEELGDLLFSVAQLGRHLSLDSEQCLRQANHKFEQRFTKMRELIVAEGHDFTAMALNDLEVYWAKAKLQE